MKNLKRNKNIIFLSNTSIALVVLNNNNVLFADEYKVNEGNIQSKLTNLLTNAANFLGSNIKNADLIFEDYNIGVKLINKQFYNCANKEEITKQIYKEARRQDEFVNNLVYGSITFNGNKANVICKTLISNYNVYNNFKNIVKHCNVKVDHCLNIATLLNNEEDNLILNINNNKAYACQYQNGDLVNCFDLKVNFDLIASKLANKFNTSKENIAKMVKLANNVECNDEVELLWNFSLANKTLTSINANEFVSAWRDELNNQIKESFVINSWKSTKIITDSSINNLNSTAIDYEIIGLDTLSVEKIMCVMNAQRIQSFENQAKYDTKIENAFETILA